jgi:translation initiation factor 3 subunit M
LYNVLTVNFKDRYSVFTALVTYAAAAGQFNLLQGCLKNFDPAAWSLDMTETRAVYKLLAQATQDCDSVALRSTSQSYVIKLLSTYENDAKGNISEAKDVAARGVVGAIKTAVNSFTQNESLIEFAAVKQLKGDSKYGKLYELLQVFSTGKVGDFTQFHKANGKYLAEQGICHDEALVSMRLLSICSLAAEHEEIPYAVIAETLQVEDAEVEEWVVRAIQSELLEAKMDQLRMVVSINRCAQRIFGVDQWKQLGEKLTSWKTNVRAMLATIESAQ